MRRTVAHRAAPFVALVAVSFCSSSAYAQQDEDDEDKGWFSLHVGSLTGHDHPYQLEIDVAVSRGATSQRVGAAVPLCDLLALEVEWGMALMNRPGASAERAWALGNPYVGLQTMLGTFGVSVASGDPYLTQQGDRLLLHRGGRDAWLFMHHHGAFVYETAVGAEIGHPTFGRLVIEMRLALAWMLGAGELGEDIGYVGTTMDVFYQLDVLRVGLEQHVGTIAGDRVMRSHQVYLGLDLDGLEARVGVTLSESDDGQTEWIGGLSVGTSFE